MTRQAIVRPMALVDVAAVSALADRMMGPGYYPVDEVERMLERSTVAGRVYSYVADQDGSGLVGARFSLPPGRWRHGRGPHLSVQGWPCGLDAAAYFQTAFVDPAHRGQGVGRALAARAIDDLRAAGARAVVAHAWKESPDNSAVRYLTRLGFRPIVEYPDYWVEVDYRCPRDGTPCHCTAVEMVLDMMQGDPPT